MDRAAMADTIIEKDTFRSGMRRIEIEELAGEKFSGEKGLWVAVLVNILNDILAPVSDSKQEEARQIVLHMDGCFKLLAETFDLEPLVLQKRILKALQRRGIDLMKEKTKE